MLNKSPHEYFQSEKLLALAGHWRKLADEADDPFRSDSMRHTAEEFERAAARAARRTQENT
jgi:hypothetical protein